MEHECSLRPHVSEQLQSARLEAPAPSDEHEHTLVVKLAVLVWVGAELLPHVQEVTEEALSHASYARPATRCWSINPHVLDLWVHPVARAEVAAFPGREDRAHEVQI